MDRRQEQCLEELARLLDALPGPASVRVVGVGLTSERSHVVPWPAQEEEGERQERRREIVALLDKMTIDCRIQVVRVGENSARAWAIPWPAALGLFDAPHAPSEIMRRWRGEGASVSEVPEAVVASLELVAAGPGKPIKIVSRKRAKFSQDCLDDILWVLQLAGTRLHGPEIARELTRRGRPWNMTSLNQTLAEAKARGALNQDERSGYGMVPPGQARMRVVHED